jgi:hypothetical protein
MRMNDPYPEMRSGTCYPSHRLLACMYPELTYVEGVVWLNDSTGAVCVDHAWCETVDGQIVDRTSRPLPPGMARHYVRQRRPALDGRADVMNGGPAAGVVG